MKSTTPSALLVATLLALLPATPALVAAPAPTVPGATWAFKTPAELDLVAWRLNALRNYVGGRGAVVRYGYMGYTWGDQALRADVASAAKPVITHFLLRAWERKLVPSLESRVVDWEPRLEALNASLGYKDREIEWQHLANMTSGYGLRERPGAAFGYNDYAVALLWDSLFLGVYRETLDTVDQQLLRGSLFSLIGAQDQPTFFAFGKTSRPGRLAISVRDFARFGLLYLNEGGWRWRRLLQPETVLLATANPPATAGLPRTGGGWAEMIAGQRTFGGGKNQANHDNSYNFAWWVNGVLADGSVRWPTAPVDAFMANGHWGRRVLFVVPSLHLVATWNDGNPDSLVEEREAVRLLMAAVR